MPTLTITGSLEPVQTALRRIADIGRDPQRVLAAAALGLEDNAKRRFDQGVDPHGVRWEEYAPLNPLYARGKQNSGHILIESGQLQRSIVSEATGHSIIVGSDEKYAAVHQFGAVIKAKNAPALSFVMGGPLGDGGELFHRQSVTIPARPYLGFSEEDRTTLIESLEAYFSAAVKG